MYRNIFKRVFDIIGALLLMPIVLLVIVIFGMMIYLEDKGSIFYLAERRGINGTIFKMFKLRSMYVDAPDIRNADNSTYNAPDDPRITKIGKFLRKTSIDELPQIINVLIGDMSFIGPRPAIVSIKYSEMDALRKKRLKVKPGITGYSQAYFRNSINQEEKYVMDCKYVDDLSFKMDISIIFQTIKSILQKKNIYTNK